MSKVPYADILNNNDSLKVVGSGVTAVFVGATNGIGLGALRALVKHTDSPTVYIVGRSLSRLDDLIKELKTINKTATFHPIFAADLGLIRDAQKAAEEIAKLAKRIDLLIMSPGYAAFYREESVEGMEPQFCVQYYSRMRFLVTLAPLLRAAPSPRVVAVLSAGNEGMVWDDDWKIQKHPIRKAIGVPISMTTLFMEEFAKQPGNERMVLAHIYPGWVGDTNFQVKGLPVLLKFFLDWVVVPLGKRIGYSSEEAGERVLFAATNGRFRRLKKEDRANALGSMIQKGVDGEVGSGVYIIGALTQTLEANKILKELQKNGMAKKVYDHTLSEFERIEKL
jgi:NAD(P)-dependent dehydrogenase (short-subunit alcohol dehydrogenase family)